MEKSQTSPLFGIKTLIRCVSFFTLLAITADCSQNKEKTEVNTAVESKRPNILFAFADDQSWLHTSAAGDNIVKTPAFDRVANEGVFFTNSFTACPSCTASRSAVISGQDIWRVKEAGVLFGSIPKDLKIYPHLLSDAGYHVGYTGKGWLPGNYRDLGLEKDPIGKEYNEVREGHIAKGIDRRDYSKNFDTFLNDRNKDQPFCFWFGSTEPHRIYEDGAGLMTGKRIEDVKVPTFWPDVDIIRSDILDYYYEIEWFDSHLASMLTKLEEIGELDNTIVVVTSDNGMPFPRAKTTLYDWGTHMPLSIRWGDKVKGGRIVNDFVSHTDFAPTFLEAAGVKVPDKMTGKSLISLLQSGKQGTIEESRDRVFTATERHTWCRPDGATYPVRAIRTKDYLYLRNFEPDRWPTGGPSFWSSNRTYHGDVDACPTKSFIIENMSQYPKEYDLNFGKRPLEELYKIADDPGQINNLANDPEYAEIKNQLWNDLSEHLKKTGDPRINGEDPWQAITYHQTNGFGAMYNMSLPEHEKNRHSLRPGN
ncbi:MAG: sulfatase [Cyclobacteriaceae bacterium]